MKISFRTQKSLKSTLLLDYIMESELSLETQTISNNTHRTSWITTKLPPEILSKLDLTLDQFLLEELGYLDPEYIISYHCDKCDKYYDSKPDLSIYIRPEKPDEFLIGDYIFICTVCNEDILCGYIEEGDKPKIEYIERDLSGKFIPIQPSLIDQLLTEAEARVSEGIEPWSLIEKVNPETITNLSNQINYDISERLQTIKTTLEKVDARRYTERVLPIELKTLEEEIDYMDGCAFERLLTYLPRITVPDNLKPLLVGVLEQAKNSTISKIKIAEEELEVAKENTQKTIVDEQTVISHLEDLIQQYS